MPGPRCSVIYFGGGVLPPLPSSLPKWPNECGNHHPLASPLAPSLLSRRGVRIVLKIEVEGQSDQQPPSSDLPHGMPLSVPSCFFLGLLLALSSFAVNPSRGIELRTSEKGRVVVDDDDDNNNGRSAFSSFLSSSFFLLRSFPFPPSPCFPRCLVAQMTDVQ